MAEPRLAISSIAWRPEETDEVLALLAELHVTGLEVAPTTVWPDPLSVQPEDIEVALDRWRRYGLKVVALQALLFGHPELLIFGSESVRRQTLAHLAGMSALASRLGAEVLIFGAPANRRTQNRPRSQVEAISRRFFQAAGRVAADAGVVLCIEPNPPAYGTDFATDAASAWRLVLDVDHPGFGLHLDGGALMTEPMDVRADLVAIARHARHFHISEPGLVEFGSLGSDQDWIADVLARSGYAHWRSIEMAADPGGGNPARIRRAISAAWRTYA